MGAKQKRPADETVAEGRSGTFRRKGPVTEGSDSLVLAVGNALHDALLIYDIYDGQKCISMVNAAACELFESSADELCGSNASSLFLEGRAPADDVERLERICITKSGARVPVQLTVSVHRAQLDGRTRVVCIAADLREHAKPSSELQTPQRFEAVGRLAAGIAHEINTPVQFVSDSVHFLRSAVSDFENLIRKYQSVIDSVSDPTSDGRIEEVRTTARDLDVEYLLANVPAAVDRSLDGLNRIATIVRSMKAFAHPDQKTMSAIDLNHAIESTLVIARNEYRYVAEVQTDFGSLPRVTCFAGELNQAFLNVIVNAAHAIGDVVQDSGTKGLICVRTRHEGDHVVVSVSDTGAGIPRAIQDRIFEPFFTTKGVGKGSGQGLALARSIIAKTHHGAIEFETASGHGTTFRIRLPIDPTGGEGETVIS